MCFFEERKTPVLVLSVLSGIVAVFGIAMIVFAALFTNSSLIEAMEKENPDIEDASSLIFILLLIFALTTILIGVVGFLFWCLRHPCYSVIYGVVLLPTWIFVLTVGVIAVVVAGTAEDHLEDQCQKVLNAYERTKSPTATSVNGTETYEIGFGFLQGGDNFDYTASSVGYSLDVYEELGIDRFMCSDECPCKPVNNYRDWWSLTRTDKGYTGVWRFDGTLSTYKECILNPPLGPNIQFLAFADAVRDMSHILDWLTYFEEEFDCAGICRPSLFYLQKSIEIGPPSSSCILSINESLNDSFMGLAICTICAGAFLFLVFIWQYCLWKKYD